MPDKKRYDVFPPKMVLKTRDLFDKVSPDDVNIDFLEQYKKSREESYSNLADFEKLGGQYLYAMDVCLTNAKVCRAFAAEADRLLGNAKNLLKSEESLAKLDRAATKYGVQDEKTGKVKITDGRAESYVALDEEVKKKNEVVSDVASIKDNWDILTNWFMDYYKWFDKKHEWVKTMLYIETKIDKSQSSY